GATTLVGVPATAGHLGMGITFLPLTVSGLLYASNNGVNGPLYTLNPATGAIVTSVPMNGSNADALDALTTNPSGTLLLGVRSDGLVPAMTSLVSIEPPTGLVTTIGGLPN